MCIVILVMALCVGIMCLFRDDRDSWDYEHWKDL